MYETKSVAKALLNERTYRLTSNKILSATQVSWRIEDPPLLGALLIENDTCMIEKFLDQNLVDYEKVYHGKSA